ncbi:MAG: signal peptidase I [Acidimicrobiales bacterium]
MKPTVKKIARKAVTGLIIVGYCTIGLVAFAVLSGYRPVVLTSGSMEPSAGVGSLVIAAPTEPADVAVGDILVMNKPGGLLVTHRVTELTDDGSALLATTKGDANETADPEPYLLADTHLTGRFVLPGVGTLLTGLANPLGPVVLVLALALAVTLTMMVRGSRSPVESEASISVGSTEQDSSTELGGSERASRPATSRGVRLLAVLGLMLGSVSLMSVTSLALFTDSETITGNQFTIGSVDLTVSQSSALVTYTSPPMNPGDQFTAPLTVSNVGSLDLRYAMSSTTTEDVAAAQLVLTVKTGVTTCDDANWAATGASIYTGVLGTTGGTAAIGSAAQGAQAGDRPLTASTNEVLCFNVTLPTAATNAVQGLTTTATFAFEAEQTVNN